MTDDARTRQPLSMTRRYRRGLILTGVLCALAVLAALLKQAVGAGLTARGLDENGEPRRNLPGGPQEN